MPTEYIIKIFPRTDKVERYVGRSGTWVDSKDKALKFNSKDQAQNEACAWVCPYQIHELVTGRYSVHETGPGNCGIYLGDHLTKIYATTSKWKADSLRDVLNNLDTRVKELPYDLRRDIADMICLPLDLVATPVTQIRAIIQDMLSVTPLPSGRPSGPLSPK